MCLFWQPRSSGTIRLKQTERTTAERGINAPVGRPRREARGQAAIRGRRRVLRIMKADGCADGLRAWRSVYSRLSVWSRKSGTSRERKARRTRSRRLRNEAHTRIKSYELVSYRSVSLTMASHEPLSKRLHVVATGDLF